MAILQFRPGAYLLKETAGTEVEFEVDFDKFRLPPNSEMEVNPSTMLVYDNSQGGTVKIYRIAPKPFTISNSTGGNK
jgi:hypothetical protein